MRQNHSLSYVKSLRFRLMLLVVVPLLIVAVTYIALSQYATGRILDQMTVAGQAAVDTGWIGTMWMWVFLASIVVLYIPLTLVIGRLIRPLRQLVAVADQLSEGDISVSVKRDRADEYGLLQESFATLVSAMKNQASVVEQIADGDLTVVYAPRSEHDTVGMALARMVEKNSGVLSGIAASAGQVSDAASQVAAGSQALAQGTTEQAAAIEHIAGGMADISTRTGDNAVLASSASELSNEAGLLMTAGMGSMDELVAAMREISEASASISNVIKVIEDIAFQTNILALNAAVEAARAGQHGKGFAVVAEEVRTLAAKSAAAAGETTAIIGSTIEKVEAGSRILKNTSDSFGKMSENAQRVNEIVGRISAASAEQIDTVERVNRALGQVSAVVQDNSATAEQSAAASEQMSSQAVTLSELVTQFHLPEGRAALPARRGKR